MVATKSTRLHSAANRKYIQTVDDIEAAMHRTSKNDSVLCFRHNGGG